MGKLVGKCRMCGTCCRNAQFVMPNDPAVKEWAEKRNFSVIQETNAFLEINIPSPCPQLNEGGCRLHGDNKPEVCRVYPEGMPEYWIRRGLDPNMSLGAHCGFRWKGDDE